MSSARELMRDLNKSYKKEVLTFASKVPPIRRVKLYNPIVDYSLGGGVAINRINEFVGAPGSTKTWHALRAIREFQHYDWGNGVQGAFSRLEMNKKEEIIPVLRRGYKPKNKPYAKDVVFVDSEGAFDAVWAKKHGVNLDTLIIIKPDMPSQAVDVTDAFLGNSDVGLVVFDSISGVGSDQEVTASMENEQMASNARFWNKALRKWQGALNRNDADDTTLIVINTESSKVGFVMGDPDAPKNGAGLKYAKSTSTRFRALKEIGGKDSTGQDVVCGRNIAVKNLKNKTARPHLEGSFYFSFINTGNLKAGDIDIPTQVVDLACRFGLIQRTGAWFQYGKLRMQGMDKMTLTLVEKDLINDLIEEVYAKFGIEEEPEEE
jgi:protein RecA